METQKKIAKISILTPSRARSERLNNFIESIYKNCECPEIVEVLNYIDSDDEEISKYQKYENDFKNKYPKFFNIKNYYLEPLSVSKSWNTLAKNSVGDILIMGNDDVIYTTYSWDKILIEETKKYKDHIYLMWFNDGVKKDTHASFPIVSRVWYNVLGYFTPGCFNFGFNDTWLFQIALYLRRAHYIERVKIEHISFKTDIKYWDSTYARNRSEEKGNLYKLDQKIWDNTHYQRIKESLKLINFIEGFK